MVLSLITMNSHSPFITINQPFLSPLTKVSVDPSDVGKIGNAPLALVTLSCRSDLNRWKWLGLKGRESNDCHGEVLGIPMRISRGKTKHTEVLHGLMLWCFSSTPVFLPWKMGAFLYRTRSLHPNSWRKKNAGSETYSSKLAHCKPQLLGSIGLMSPAWSGPWYNLGLGSIICIQPSSSVNVPSGKRLQKTRENHHS